MNKTIERERGTLEVTLGPVTVDSVGPHPFKGDTRDQAQVRQVYVIHYPAGRPNNSLVDDLFAIDEFGIESSLDAENIRVSWIDIPLGTTVQQVENQLASFPESCIYRILGDDVRQVMHSGQLFAATSDQFPDYNYDKAKRRHVVMSINPKDGKLWPMTKDNQWLEDSVILTENGKVEDIIDETRFQYRATAWSREYKDDTDLRKKTPKIVLEQPATTDKAKTEL